jgi:hypothetical protein
MAALPQPVQPTASDEASGPIVTILIEERIRHDFRRVSDPAEIFNSENAFLLNDAGQMVGLNACECGLADVTALAEMPFLEYLDLSSNRIVDASPLESLTSLARADLAFNRVERMDFALRLPRLGFLDLRNNAIVRVPRDFASSPLAIEPYEFQQQGLFLDGNPLESPPMAIVRQGGEAVRTFLAELPEGDDPPLLPGRGIAPRRLAETSADTVPDPGFGRVRSADRLGTASDADMLVSVLMARDTAPPLAVGLFGDWGSGKSFFMALMQERVEELAALRRQGRPEAAPFCGEVRQVRFNAWHFVDSNLWASLAAALFDGLAREVRGDEAAEMLSDLDAAREDAAAATLVRETLEREVRVLEDGVDRFASIARSAATAALQAARRDPGLVLRLRALTNPEATPDEEAERVVAAIGRLDSFTQVTSVGLRLIREEAVYRRRRSTVIALAVLAGLAALALLATEWSAVGKLAACLGAAALGLTT